MDNRDRLTRRINSEKTAGVMHGLVSVSCDGNGYLHSGNGRQILPLEMV